jgi:hypothetical protein
MLDYYRVEAAKKGPGEGGMEPLWKSYEEMLRYRRELSERRDRLEAGITVALAMPDLPEAARAALRVLLPDNEDEEG